MAAKKGSSLHVQTDSLRVVSMLFLLGAAVLFLGSAALQLAASLRRWVVFRGSSPPEEFRGEDHLYDYFFPVDPWQHIGWVAQAFGAGALIQALGVAAMAAGVLLAFGAATARRTIVVDIAVAALVVAACGFLGAHALISGIAGSPSPLQHFIAVLWLPMAGLVALGVRWRSRMPAAAAACFLLLGTTVAGFIVASSMIAPFMAGYVSHDTTPWTESVMAAAVAASGIALLFAAWAVSRYRDGTPAANSPADPGIRQLPPTVAPH